MSKPSQAEIHRVLRWYRLNDPAALAAEGLNVLRPLARTGDAVAAMQLRALGALKDPEGAGLQTRKGHGAAPLAEFLKKAVECVRNKTAVIEDAETRKRIEALPSRPRDDPSAWFETAWALYELSGRPENDETVRRLGHRAQSTGEKPVTAIRRAVERAFMRRYAPPAPKT